MQFRFVPTKVHGAVDYVTSPALLAAPELLRLDGARASALAPRVAGAAGALYSGLTDYELGIRRTIPMRVHLALDAVAGTALALAPWLSRSSERGVRHWLPHAIIGGSEIALALTTKTDTPQPARRLVRALRRLDALPPAGRAVVIVLPLAAAAAAAYAGRRRVFQAIAVAADAVEEVADTVEDAAEDLAGAGRGRAGMEEDSGREEAS